MAGAPPRYRLLADELRALVSSGQYGPGDLLPTEMEICAEKGVSRHTAREALRILGEEGLIERRRGSGTVVAGKGPPAFAQPIGDFDSILQYARDAHLDITEEEDADEAVLERFGLIGDYRLFRGLRRVPEAPPQAATTVLIRSDLAPDATTVAGLRGPISEWMEENRGVAIDRVVQRMEAVALPRHAAHALGLPQDTPALRTVRRYRDAQDAVLLLSESLHPAGRFAYEIRLNRRPGVK